MSQAATSAAPPGRGAIDRRILDQKADPERFRHAVRDWLAEHTPRDWSAVLAASTQAGQVRYLRDWLLKLDSVGLAASHWPAKWGGEDLPIPHQVIVYEEFARANAPSLSLFTISRYHLPATLFAWGAPEQTARYLPGARQGVVWCQGFSEPGAGSDLAALRTRAERVGDHYRVTGQKVWSSYAGEAEHCLLLARTGPSEPKHAGISYFILHMDSPGVTVRRIPQMNGDAEFCEIFLDGVEIPAANLIGAENQGWAIAQSTLSAERGLIVFELAERMQLFMERLLRRELAAEWDWTADDELRRGFTSAYGQLQGVRGLIRRMLQEIETTGGAQQSPVYVKLLFADVIQRFTDLCLRLVGPEAQIQRPPAGWSGFQTGDWLYEHLSSWSWTISGGSSEIMRNIIAERFLKLPR